MGVSDGNAAIWQDLEVRAMLMMPGEVEYLMSSALLVVYALFRTSKVLLNGPRIERGEREKWSAPECLCH